MTSIYLPISATYLGTPATVTSHPQREIVHRQQTSLLELPITRCEHHLEHLWIEPISKGSFWMLCTFVVGYKRTASLQRPPLDPLLHQPIMVAMGLL
ncbi:hypothetical protein WG66_002243 [Moniliophthora roreri]|nr:hypothetical protein WG66_002243 [Moniliophthora roreri]